jgi:branched-chain amino acid transport system substrate-binding protein
MRWFRRPGARAALVAAVALALVVGPTTQAGAAKASGEPIKVMVIGPTDTQIANYPDIPAAATVAVDAINKGGGIGANQQPLDLTYCNDQFTSNGAAACARQAVDDGVVAVVGGFSNFGNVIFPVLESAGIPAIGFWPSSTVDFNSPMAYLTGAGVLGGYVGAGRAAKALGKKSIATALAVAGNPSGDRVKAGAEESGIDYEGTIDAPFTTTDYAPIVSRLKDSGAEAVALAVGPTAVVSLITSASQLGYEPLWITPNGNLSLDNLDTLGPLAKGIGFTGSLPPASETSGSKQLRRFTAQFAASAKKGTIDDVPLGATGVSTWLAFEALKQVTADAQTIDRASLVSAMNAAKNIDLYGIIPSWTPTAAGPAGFSRISNPFEYISEWNGKKYVLVQKKPFDLTPALANVTA